MSEVNEIKYNELVELKLDPASMMSCAAKKSGPGMAWSKAQKTHCGVLNCPSDTLSCQKLWFFKLPVNSSDSQRRKQWLEKIKRLDIQHHQRLLVCENHFDPLDITGSKLESLIKPKSRKYLRKGSIPTRNLPPENEIIQKSLHQSAPKRIYKRAHQQVNKDIDQEPSTSGTQNTYAFKKPKTSQDLETIITVKIEPNTFLDYGDPAITVNTENIEPNTSIKKENDDIDSTITVKTENIEPNTFLTYEGTSSLMTDEEIKTELELTEQVKRLINLSNTPGKTLETFMKLKDKLGNEPYDENDKYSDEFELLILDMYYAYPQYYECLAHALGLPPASALKSFKPLTVTYLHRYSLQRLVAKFGKKQEKAMLCFEIVKLMPHVYYDYVGDEINGVNKRIVPYKFAIIAMAQGISGEWHQILSVYIFEAIQSIVIKEFRSWTDKLMFSLEENGISVIALVTSTDDFFFKAYSITESSKRHLASSLHYFMQNGKKIWHIFDPFHLIMCLHDELQNNSFVFHDNKKAEWEHVKQFHFLATERLDNRSFTITPESSQQEKLESAAAILLERKMPTTLFEMGILSEEAMQTASFLKHICEIFPVAMAHGMSASTKAIPNKPTETAPRRGQKNKTKKLIKSIMNKNLRFLEKLEYCPKSNEHEDGKVIKCLVSSFESILSLYEAKNINVTSTEEIPEIISKFNLNPLVIFIDTIKRSNTNITSEVVMESINQNLIQNQDETTIDAFVGYCDRMIELDQFHREKKNKPLFMKEHSKYISDYDQIDDDDRYSINHLANYLVEQIILHFRKSVSVQVKMVGCHATFNQVSFVDFLELLVKLDTVFVENCKMAMLSGTWYASLKKAIHEEHAFILYCTETQVLNFISDLFIHSRIYHVLKYNNNMYAKDGDSHKFAVKRLEGYKLKQGGGKLESLDCFRNQEKP